jgi:NADH-quinone oxidoreductase subunit L
MLQAAAAILALPLLAFVVIVFLTWRQKALSSFVAIAGVGVAMLLALLVVVPGTFRTPPETLDWEWLRLYPGGEALTLGIQVDPLTAIMLVVVTVVSFLVQVYSRGYMVEHGHLDPGYSRFFAYLSLFTFSMLAVVLADNLLFFFIGWELVGLCSYLLIGFWYERLEQPGVHLLPPWVAAKKAFLTTRVGDVGFLIGLIVVWNAGGTLRFAELFDQVEHHTGNLFNPSLLGQPVLFWACLCLFAGAIGKSGQFPLHVWLPDAMEGPTPVSALIHAATMVAAGVFLVARTFPFFEAEPTAKLVVAIIGGFTAIFAATMGLVNNDIKRVLAFSTVSQLGYMMLALGAGGLAAGMFHLFTHAFFKALLFLCAGSVIHSTGPNDIREMGGLRRYMPITWITMGLGALSLAGFPLFSGFWSKDEVIAQAALGGGPVLLAFAVITVFLTAFYTFRMFFLTFHGAYRGGEEPGHSTPEPHEHRATPHESGGWMTVPLLVLAIPTVLVGFWGAPQLGSGFQRYLERQDFQEGVQNVPMMVLGAVLAIAGIAVAWLFYGIRTNYAVAFGRTFRPIYTLLLNRYYVDELYMWLIDKLVLATSRGVSIFDRQALDAAFDGLARLFRIGGGGLRTVQTGRVQNYGLVLFGGLALIAILLVLPIARA